MLSKLLIDCQIAIKIIELRMEKNRTLLSKWFQIKMYETESKQYVLINKLFSSLYGKEFRIQIGFSFTLSVKTGVKFQNTN